jgi:hypothetical protein
LNGELALMLLMGVLFAARISVIICSLLYRRPNLFSAPSRSSVQSNNALPARTSSLADWKTPTMAPWWS